MSVVNHTFTGNFVTRYFQEIASGILPSKLKQLFFVTSGIARLLREKLPSLDFLSQINQRLRSGYRTVYMVIPAYASESLWRDVDIPLSLVCPSAMAANCDVARFSDEDLWRIGMVFAIQCPSWLKYGSKELMATDIHDTLHFVGRLKAA